MMRIILSLGKMVSLPRKGNPLCGASLLEVLWHKASTGVKKTLLFDSDYANAPLHP